MSHACGIDFGTSNSAVAVSSNGRVRLLPLQDGVTSVPTALFFSFDDDTCTHGRAAMERYLSREPGRLLRSIKSLLGTPLFEEVTQVKYRRYAYGEIIADFLKFLRVSAAREMGGDPRSVVIGRPAYFVDDDQPADDKAQAQLEAAARAAGFETIAFQFEPIAAALHYEQSVTDEEIALVADIGGGTSDFSVLRVSPRLATKIDRRGDILGYNGVHIGGTDFDRLLSMATLMPFLGLGSKLRMKGMDAPSWYFADLATWHRINVLYDGKVLTEVRSVRRDSAEPEKIDRLLGVLELRKGHELLGRIEQAKIDMSSMTAATVSLADVAQDFVLEIKRRRFEQAIGESLGRIEGRVRDVIALAGLKPGTVRTVFLTGGSSGIPAVRNAVTKVVPAAQVVVGDAFGSVAAGLAIDAERRFNRRSARLSA
ncbi:MAG: heat-shock protein [Hyphomicrobium sp.]|nr:MAG: heat-shock protein [Hyphomicrobium sp.]